MTLVGSFGEVLDAPHHPNLTSPYSRIQFGSDVAGFLERYSTLGGTHHQALAYGDLREELAVLADLCRIEYTPVET